MKKSDVAGYVGPENEGFLFQRLFHALYGPTAFYLWSMDSVGVLTGEGHNHIFFIKHFIDLYENNNNWDF